MFWNCKFISCFFFQWIRTSVLDINLFASIPSPLITWFLLTRFLLVLKRTLYFLRLYCNTKKTHQVRQTIQTIHFFLDGFSFFWTFIYYVSTFLGILDHPHFLRTFMFSKKNPSYPFNFFFIYKNVCFYPTRVFEPTR